jgi:hypothetical protein
MAEAPPTRYGCKALAQAAEDEGAEEEEDAAEEEKAWR